MTKKSEALATMGEPNGGALTIAQHKKFVELALASNLDKRSPEEQQNILVAVGRAWGLRPEAGDLMLFQGRLYVTIRGMYRNAHRNGLFAGAFPRPASHAAKASAGYAAEDVVWMCEVWKKGADRAFVGWGCVRRTEIEQALERAKSRSSQPTPVVTHTAEIAKKRAIYDALRIAFPLLEDISGIHERFIFEAEAALAAAAPKRTTLAIPKGYDFEDVHDEPAPDEQLVEEGVVGHEGDLESLAE